MGMTPDHWPAGSTVNSSLVLQGIARAPEQGNFLPPALPTQSSSAVLCAVPAVNYSCASRQQRFWAPTSHPWEEKFHC